MRELFLENYDERITELLTNVLGVKVIDFKTMPKTEGVIDILIGVEENGRKRRIYLDDMAEGVKRIISYLSHAISRKNGMLIAEESETHLHTLAISYLAATPDYNINS